MSQTLATPLTFVVEEAGCHSCATRVRSALDPLARIERIDTDHDADVSTVRLVPERELTEDEVNDALAAVSEGTGHTYRVRPGSWSAAG